MIDTCSARLTTAKPYSTQARCRSTVLTTSKTAAMKLMSFGSAPSKPNGSGSAAIQPTVQSTKDEGIRLRERIRTQFAKT